MTEGRDLSVEIDRDTYVATVTIHRPPNNFFDTTLIRELCDTFESLDNDGRCRAIVLASEGKHFCAGRDFSRKRAEGDTPLNLYSEAVRLIRAETPWVAAVQGAAVGGGLGLAAAADFRVAAPTARFSAIFSRLGTHHGFGLTVLLPRIVGTQHAMELLYTGERIDAERAAAIGLVDRLVPADTLLQASTGFAERLAAAAPLAMRAIRRTMRADLAERFTAATDHEVAEQARLYQTEDFKEGAAAARDRRAPRFVGR